MKIHTYAENLSISYAKYKNEYGCLYLPANKTTFHKKMKSQGLGI